MDSFGKFFRVLFCRQMREQVGNQENRIVFVFTDTDFLCTAVAECHDAVERERNSGPLIFFDAAVVVGLKEGETTVLIQRFLFQVQTGAVNVRTYRVESFCQGVVSHDRHIDGLPVIDIVDFITGFQ